MSNPFNILLVSRKKEVLDALEQLLSEGDIVHPRRKLILNGHVDPLHAVDEMPDLLILHLSQSWREELEAIIARRPERRPALIVVGASTDANVMRLAMQAGARDLLTNPIAKADLFDAIAHVARERPTAAHGAEGTIAAFINAKGGSGATLLASNVAHIMAAESKQRVALFDLDLQFGAAPLYLDLFPKRGLMQALENLGTLDEVALQGYFIRHASGLDVMSHGVEDPLMAVEPTASAIRELLDVALLSHERLIIDLPRRVDAVTTATLERANQVVLVLQQSVTALRDAARLLQWLRADLRLSKDQLVVVVNRFEKHAPVSIDDVRKTLNCDDPVLVPNDFKTVSECINSGTPLLNYARGSAITKAIMGLETRLGGASAKARSGGFGKVFSGLLGGRS